MDELIDRLKFWYHNSPLFQSKVMTSVFVVVFVLGSAYGIYQVLLSESEVSVCAEEGFPSRCYNIVPEMCEVVWTQADGKCREYISTLKLSPGRLTGPILSKCKFAHFDQTFSQSRKSTSECKEAFADLEGWKQRNDFN